MLSLEELARRVKLASDHLSSCRLCPRECGTDRRQGHGGFCRSGLDPKVYSFFAHHGEEPVLSGFAGSGTIFFSNCTLSCVYCQNYQISQLGEGEEMTVEKLALIMLDLAKEKVHNLNLVTPTHYLPQILRALYLAQSAGFNLPIVYNTSGYESEASLRLLEGVVDIYLADMRYGDDKAAAKYSKAPHYVAVNQAAVREMQRQVGGLQIVQGLATRGLLVRHLVLPEDQAGTETVLRFIAAEISPATYVSLMSQYHPVYQAAKHAPLNRKITYAEYLAAQKLLKKYHLRNGWCQAPPPKENSSQLLGTNFPPRRLVGKKADKDQRNNL